MAYTDPLAGNGTTQTPATETPTTSTTPTTGTTTTTTTTTSGTSGGNWSLNDRYQSLIGDHTDELNNMYNAQRESALADLENTYNINQSDWQHNRDLIDKQYNASANDLAVQYERNRRNANEQALANGINTGVGSQMDLAQNSTYQRDYGNLRASQNEALSEQDRAMQNMKLTYQADVRKAIADNDYALAAALMNEWDRQASQTLTVTQMQYEELANRAALLANAGDYSGYTDLFGLSNDQQGQLEAQWIVSNPDAAYNMGLIDKKKYKAITGKNPKGNGLSNTENGTNSTNNRTGWEGSEYSSWYDKARQSYYASDAMQAQYPTLSAYLRAIQGLD